MGDKTLEETHAQNAQFFFNLASYIVASLVTIKHFPNIAAHFPPDTLIEDYVDSRMTEIINSLQHDPEVYKKDLLQFYQNGITHLQAIPLSDSNSFEKLAKYSLLVRGLYLSFSNYSSLETALPAISHMESLASDTRGKAMELVAYWTAEMKHRMVTSDRVAKSKEAMIEKKKENKQLVLDAYFRCNIIKDTMRPHTMAKMIHKYLETNKKTSPSLSSIKRYLAEETLI